MNRVVLIGNGFDLAHGLKTSYTHFINWYLCRLDAELRKTYYSVYQDGLCRFETGNRYYRMADYMASCPKYRVELDFREWLKENTNVTASYSPLFENIIGEYYSKNWVDIEYEYYKLLLKSVREGYPTAKAINGQLNSLQMLLAEYLSSLTEIAVEPIAGIREYICEPVDRENLASSSKDIVREDQYKMRTKYGVNSECLFDKGGTPENIMLLNFNYTSLTDLYVHSKVSQSIHVHGSLENPEQMIFGYGDDLDEDHKLLVKPQDNELLRNDKSVRYLEADNYRRILRFIDSDAYQVYIMGHSCGNSDRTLLNTLFEHKNCVSIKPFYYEHDGKDNYLDIVQNISRNFTNAQLMRDRVVNKTQCHPLPQAK